MDLHGIEFIAGLARQPSFSAKLVMHEAGAMFFSASQQHRDQKTALISYEDDYAGNALAAMVAPGHIEIRYHRDFSDGRVARLIATLLSEPRLAFMRSWRVTYQGRTIRGEN